MSGAPGVAGLGHGKFAGTQEQSADRNGEHADHHAGIAESKTGRIVAKRVALRERGSSEAAAADARGEEPFGGTGSGGTVGVDWERVDRIVRSHLELLNCTGEAPVLHRSKKEAWKIESYFSRTWTNRERRCQQLHMKRWEQLSIWRDSAQELWRSD